MLPNSRRARRLFANSSQRLFNECLLCPRCYLPPSLALVAPLPNRKVNCNFDPSSDEPPKLSKINHIPLALTPPYEIADGIVSDSGTKLFHAPKPLISNLH